MKSQLKLLNKPKRSQQTFNKLYPRHKMGGNCYGVPKIKNALPNATLSIGNYCSIAKNVQIYLGGNHRLDWVTTFPFPAFFQHASHIKDYETTKGDVSVGSDVWLGENSTILSGVTIGHGAVIAAGAIVTKDVSPYEIVGGNPAKHIRWRFDETTRNALLQSTWWDWPEEELLSIVDVICSNDISAFLDYVNNKQTPNEFKI
ncbi:MAG: CatB-related O-acetyltransferase [Methylotenera sp.]|uniref:CatB-related O-acetyltransferase n=1 Tax=Methylotenera sp. TaxID=2051956 RepID=UPI002489A6BC|nr:CatB-related O-acetyltransferase [Methylotenera sp.]MDI1308274.1 CatB-related O-acetyltransferase [Methylotenera sp.]